MYHIANIAIASDRLNHLSSVIKLNHLPFTYNKIDDKYAVYEIKFVLFSAL